MPVFVASAKARVDPSTSLRAGWLSAPETPAGTSSRSRAAQAEDLFEIEHALGPPAAFAFLDHRAEAFIQAVGLHVQPIRMVGRRKEPHRPLGGGPRFF